MINGKTYDIPLTRELWSDWPKEKEKEKLLDAVTINIASLLPVDRVGVLLRAVCV